MINCIPNILSSLRLLLAPVFYTFINRNYYVLSLIVLIIGALLDFLDGYLARKYKAVSSIGIMLDPLADKVFTNTVLWGLYFNLHLLGVFILACLSTLRDLLIICGSLWILIKDKSTKNVMPTLFGKIYTAFSFSFCILILCVPKNVLLINIGSLICIVLLLVSSIAYIIRFYKNK